MNNRRKLVIALGASGIAPRIGWAQATKRRPVVGVIRINPRNTHATTRCPNWLIRLGPWRGWDAEVDKLRAKGDQLSAEARAKYDEQLKAMRASRDAANKKLQEMGTAGESAWQQMQAGMDTAWASMKNALDKATSQFKK